MPHYLDIGVVRIQHYLSRTPTLRGRRGASAALVAATAAEDLPLRGRASVNEQAGHIDGVVSLVADRPDETLVRELLEHLRAKVPGAEFRAAWGDADDYLHARPQIKRMVELGEATVDLPAGAEFPLAALCGICRVDPVDTRVGRVPLASDNGTSVDRDVCADCAIRHKREIDQRTVEARLKRRIGASELPRGFNELADLAGKGDKKHLATVYADGNSVGTFFDVLARLGGEADHAVAVKRLTESTFDALAAATCAVRQPNDPALCVVPHLVGGDDVLVSLPADRAWRFAMEFVGDFGQRMQRLARDLDVTGAEVPTMSAGVVFGRRDHPFTMSVEQAERCLRQAKSAGAGRAAWIQFADMVSDGAEPDGHAVSLAALQTNRKALSRLVTLPRSNQYRLAESLDRGGLTEARTLAARLGHTEVIRPFLLEEASARDDEVIDLGQALRIARWWR